MPRAFPAAVLLALAACTPTFNWREVTIDPPALHATFPCKPDSAERKMQFSRDRDLLVHATGCEAGGASFAVLWADVGSPADVAAVLDQWKQASLATAHSRIEREESWVPRGSLALAQSVVVRASGQRPDGAALQAQSAYFARNNVVFQAVVFAPALKAEMTEPFFAGLAFQ